MCLTLGIYELIIYLSRHLYVCMQLDCFRV